MTNIPWFLHSLSCSDSGVCVWGCNPHCHFILLLRSLSFDHSVLLDFLISSETCFLEYCVRYLKLLRKDRTAFSSSCHHIEDCDGAGRRTDPSVQLPLLFQKRWMWFPALDRQQVMMSHDWLIMGAQTNPRRQKSVFLTRNSGNTEADSGRTISGMALEQVQTEHASDSLLGKVFVCLMDLRTAVTRLHNRGLFPYNPTSLLKLLNSIEPQRNTLS